MAKIRQKINITDQEDAHIRRVYDRQRGRWYFSVTDIMGILTESVDARNYWKALKNRLKNSHNQLVMDCNQLKMTASDGKSYLVDTADADTIIKIIQIIAPYNETAFQSWFEHIDASKLEKDNSSVDNNTSKASPADPPYLNLEKEISTDIKIHLDILENSEYIVVKTLLPNFDSDEVFISVTIDTITIKGTLKNPKNIQEDYLYRELNWGKFYRQIKLPNLIDVEKIEATEIHGLLTITLTKIDQNKTRFIKVKSM